MSFVSELRRRQVFRTAAWYGGIAWLAIEVANTVFPQFSLPAWSVRAVIVAALLGLPVALMLAWSFDLTGSGLRREDDTRGRAGHRAPGRRLADPVRSGLPSLSAPASLRAHSRPGNVWSDLP